MLFSENTGIQKIALIVDHAMIYGDQVIDNTIDHFLKKSIHLITILMNIITSEGMSISDIGELVSAFEIYGDISDICDFAKKIEETIYDMRQYHIVISEAKSINKWKTVVTITITRA